jgi:bifunctional UDP-N-acetylglucosamine pyrophosphorylase/glucosamine-1-phosphate N-acetyltransferase
VEPYDPVNGNAGFHYLIVFDPQRFLAARSAGIDEIYAQLEHQDAEKDNIFSIKGKPFFAISRMAFEKLNFNLEKDKDITLKLRNNGNVRLLNLKERVEVLDVERNMRIIEDLVIIYQAESLRSDGVIVEDRGHFYIEGMVPIGSGSIIGPGVVIKGDSSVGKGVHIYPNCYIENSVIGDNCLLLPGCILRDSVLENDVQIGPYTHLRSGALVKTGAKMGNFVEMKKSTLGQGSKAMHLTYIGDAEVGKSVNIGAGTITCNYDGINKNKTVIEDGVFIGSGTELVAPITLRKNSYVGAGSTITEEVPEDSLAVARNKQRNITGWVARKNRKKA